MAFYLGDQVSLCMFDQITASGHFDGPQAPMDNVCHRRSCPCSDPEAKFFLPSPSSLHELNLPLVCRAFHMWQRRAAVRTLRGPALVPTLVQSTTCGAGDR